MSMRFEHAQNVVDELPEEFYSHDFIEKYIDLYEREYLAELIRYALITPQRGAFKKLHSHMGLFLTRNMEKLHIRKDERGNTKNIKGNSTENQKWIKTP